MDSHKSKLYGVCSEIYGFRAECERKGSKGGEKWIVDDYFEIYKEAAKMCGATVIDLGEKGESDGLVKRDLRKVVIAFEDSKPRNYISLEDRE